MKKQYRKVKKYTKSSRKYMLERARRREIIAFSQAGFTQREIAAKLGVCVKTVSRDVKRLQRYFSRLNWVEQKKINEILNARFAEVLKSVPMDLQFQLLGKLMAGDKRTKNKAFDALLTGNIPVLTSIAARPAASE